MWHALRAEEKIAPESFPVIRVTLIIPTKEPKTVAMKFSIKKKRSNYGSVIYMTSEILRSDLAHPAPLIERSMTG